MFIGITLHTSLKLTRFLIPLMGNCGMEQSQFLKNMQIQGQNIKLMIFSYCSKELIYRKPDLLLKNYMI